MTTEQQIRALAELDGKCSHPQDQIVSEEWEDGNDGGTDWTCKLCKQDPHYSPCPAYLTSYDAIIPLIQRQTTKTHMLMFEIMCRRIHAESYEVWFESTPSQLCEALLRSTGKWVE